MKIFLTVAEEFQQQQWACQEGAFREIIITMRVGKILKKCSLAQILPHAKLGAKSARK